MLSSLLSLYEVSNLNEEILGINPIQNRRYEVLWHLITFPELDMASPWICPKQHLEV